MLVVETGEQTFLPLKKIRDCKIFSDSLKISHFFLSVVVIGRFFEQYISIIFQLGDQPFIHSFRKATVFERFIYNSKAV